MIIMTTCTHLYIRTYHIMHTVTNSHTQTHIQTHTLTHTMTHTCTHTDTLTHTDTDKQTDRQTDRHTHTHTVKTIFLYLQLKMSSIATMPSVWQPSVASVALSVRCIPQ